ncbi:hypothetical protein [Nocardia arthritidis]|uniref:Uncharacterized protein n=1 Tax=Nocardia arthritidis TaxID=228602 RepID=A0A6G9YM50_9NOCA|nr:hypothetical protein [Nocardia arthritidis]QIS14147.1 hypothetical protein F5544_31530 [Nocardia arthritidis]
MNIRSKAVLTGLSVFGLVCGGAAMGLSTAAASTQAVTMRAAYFLGPADDDDFPECTHIGQLADVQGRTWYCDINPLTREVIWRLKTD